MFSEFKAFVMRGNVVDLAVAVIIGAAHLPDRSRGEQGDGVQRQAR